MTGWQLNGSAISGRLAMASARGAKTTPSSGACTATSPACSPTPHQLFDFEAREHTAQVEQDDRLEREARFRFTRKDRDEWREKTGKLEWLPCNVLLADHGTRRRYLVAEHRLHAQRAAHAGQLRAAQRPGRARWPAGAGHHLLRRQSPHDQYYFRDPVRMVHGQVNPPTLDLANRELVQSHMHAIWLAETGKSSSATAFAACWT
jgi:hypothetical protein